MGEMVEFPSNGDQARGYLARPASGSGPGVLVLQEWWGVVPQIKRVCDRLAAEGFVALVPDLYHGEFAEHTEMDKAASLMTSMPMDRAARDMGGAIDALLANQSVSGEAVGVIGFCMGGMLALVVAAHHGERVAVVTPFYGAPLGEAEPDWNNLSAPVLGHFAENDDFFPVEAVKQLGQKLEGMGKDVTFEVLPGVGHAFCNETNPLGTYDEGATEQVWDHTMEFLHSQLG
jgi:carboxymethylenebutenolidase